MTSSYSFFAGKKAIEALRKTGYTSTAMALGELIDNSLQENAKHIDIIVIEKGIKISTRSRRVIQRIAVLDDGNGMDKTILRRSLRMGDGTRFSEKKGMGKYGVGLPQASISQCKRVDIWSWQKGIKNALHTYIDLDNQEWIEKSTIPNPLKKSIPSEYRNASKNFSKNGTLIVWSSIDQCNYRTSKHLFENSEFMIGRMYRNWIRGKGKKATIRMISINEDDNNEREEYSFKANDPTYLLKGTSVLNPPVDPMFLLYNTVEKDYLVFDEKGKPHKERVNMIFTRVQKGVRETLDATPAGRKDFGKHAKKNMGLSIVREGRELELDRRWVLTTDPRERWWGAEIQFGRGLDDVFGISNNKQQAINLSAMAQKDYEDFQIDDGETENQVLDRLKEEEPNNYILLDVSRRLKTQISTVRQKIISQPVRKKGKKAPGRAETAGTKGTNARKKKGLKGKSDEDEKLSKSKRETILRDTLSRQGYDKTEINRIINEVIQQGMKYSYVDRDIDTSAFFSIEPIAGVLIITRNTNHNAYEKIFSTLDYLTKDTTKLKQKEVSERLDKANEAIKILLEAWARLEDEASSKVKGGLTDTRHDWGRIARDFILESEEE